MKAAGAMKAAEPGAVIGLLIDIEAVEKVEARIADAVKKGYKVVTGGNRRAGQHLCEPTADSERQRGSSRNVVGRISARTIDCA
jgi:acyl-CoA reductase-like NAD-dependent aldehyde dehydrogenase